MTDGLTLSIAQGPEQMLMLLDPGLCAALRGLGSAISILVMLMAAWAIGLRHAARRASDGAAQRPNLSRAQSSTLFL
jgi:hypothetical protein